MKKVLAVVLALAMVLSMAACGGQKQAAPAATPAPETHNYQLGLGVYNPAGTIKEATDDADATVQVSPCVAAILVDEEGKIVECKIDVAQTKVAVDAEGKVLFADADLRTKLEKLDDYGMQKASKLEKGEWYQQAEAFQNFLVGKTVEDVNAMGIENGYPTDADLLAGCTIHITDFVAAVNDAFDRLIEAGNAETITLGVIVEDGGSKDETAEAAGLVFFQDVYAATAVDADGIITAAQLDETQIKFPVEGAVIADAPNYLSKIQLKENYGMQKASGLKEGEWYQQAPALCSNLVGLDAAGVEAIALDDAGHATDADILAGCTMKIGTLLECVVKGF